MAAAAAIRRFKPLFDRVLVEKVAVETKTKAGILLPEKAQGAVNEAVVIAVGPGIKNKKGELEQVSVSVGDKVMIPEYGGTKLKMGDKDYYLYRDGDLLGTFED